MEMERELLRGMGMGHLNVPAMVKVLLMGKDLRGIEMGLVMGGD
uniref:Uncharacterized protein n=1 Tax=Arcella intermedia TaxID=1963864 RepID=A0A6B2LVW4_9EUKA